MLCCGQAIDECEIATPAGDIGGVNGEGDIAETAEGEPGKRLKAEAMSIALAADRGDATPDPVDI